MDIEVYTKKRIEELKQARVSLGQALEVIAEKIVKADAKKKTEKDTENYHKWNVILKELEGNQDQTRRELNSAEAELKEKEEKLEELHANAQAAIADREKLAERVMSMSVEELAALSKKEMDILREYELSQGTAAEPGQAEEEEKAKEAEEEAKAKAKEDAQDAPAPPPPPKKKKPLLVATIGKIRSGNIDELTFGEFEMLVSDYIATGKLTNPTEHQASMHASLKELIVVVQKEAARLLMRVLHMDEKK
jgi:hypothetical protein